MKRKLKLEVATIVTLSTAHVSGETAKKMPQNRADLNLKNTPDWWPDFLRDEGWLFYLYNHQYDDRPFFDERYVNAPKELKDVLAYVRSQGHSWCLFDCDGPIVDGLYKYEW